MKKRIVTLLLALCLLLPASALTEAAPALTTLDLGDFTIEIDPDTPYELYEKADGEDLIAIFPAYVPSNDVFSQLHIAWFSDQIDYQEEIASAYNSLDDIKENYEANGLSVPEIGLLALDIIQLNGKDALKFDFYFIVNYGSADEESGDYYTFFERIIFVNISDGFYRFDTITLNQSSLDAYAQPVIDSIIWK